MSVSNYICIDIGGTAIKHGLARADGQLLVKGSVLNDVRQSGAAAMVRQVQGLARHYLAGPAGPAIRGIAVSTAGMVDAERGEITYAASHFPGYSGMKLRQLLEEDCQLPCTVENDVNAAALGEYWRGAGQGASSLFCLTVGTGIGGAAVLDGCLIRGASGSAGEIGYLPVGGDGKTLEDQASVTALIRAVAAEKGLEPSRLDGRAILGLARSGDRPAQAGLERMIRCLAQGIASVCYLFNPQVVIVGGGIMEQAGYFKPRLEQAMAAVLLPFVYERTDLAFASLGNDAGMIGALYCHLQKESMKEIE
jgi:predicted NBD/HSP70 family sugar kinase